MRQCKAHVQAARAVVSEQPAARASLTEVRVREHAYFVLVDKIWSRPSGGGDSDESRRVDIVLDSCS